MSQTHPFYQFKTSPEITRLVIIISVRFPLLLRNVEDLLQKPGTDVSHETVRLVLGFAELLGMEPVWADFCSRDQEALD